jgi:CRISPR-associated protein Cas1
MTTLYLTEPGTVIHCKNQVLDIVRQEQHQTCRLAEVSLIVVMPGVQLTSVTLSRLFDRNVETIFLDKNGQFRGRLQGQYATNPMVRIAQYQLLDTTFGMAIAQRMVDGKVRNQRVLLQRRNRRKPKRAELSQAIDRMGESLATLRQRETPQSRDTLMGIEGNCAQLYYQALRHCFAEEWNFTGRNRRPPRDPINALLSWGYSILLSRSFVACVQAGLDPYVGYFHAVQPYRPNLVLDVMEEFRPVVVDQAVIALVQSGVLTPDDFEPSPDGEGIWLGPLAKKLFLTKLEQQFNSTLLYPSQNRRLSLVQIMFEQARSLGRCLVDRQLDYEPFVIR